MVPPARLGGCELAPPDRLRRILDVEERFRPGDMADPVGLGGGDMEFPDYGDAIARQQFQCNVFLPARS